MKKALLSSAVLLATTLLFAQPGPRPDGPPKPPPVSERWKHDSTKLQLYVVLSPGQIGSVKSAFVTFYNDVDALMQQNGSNPPAPPAKEEMDKIRTKRDNALKALLNAQQFSRFETFGKEFMPPRPPKPPGPHGATDKV